MTNFADLGLADPLLRALAAEGYTAPTPIQAQAIPHLLAGKDVLGLAQTGTGKTAAFALPLLQRLAEGKRAMPKSSRVLVLTPTRELAVQVSESFRTYGSHLRLRHALVFGGVGMVPQIKTMAGGVDVLVATPGRLLDLMGQNAIRLDSVEALVLDEADRMLDMGFIVPIRKIVAAVPAVRQTILFSATMPEAIASLAAGVLHNPVRVEVAPVSTTAERIEQKVLFVEREHKRTLLAELLADRGVERALVFTRTKHGANRVAELLEKAGVPADAIHGNKSQGARQKALASLRDGSIKALVATDIAARGIDIDGVTHVINFELPNEPESYVHRIGRTARAGAEGIAISLCDADEVAYLRDIEKTIRQAVPVDDAHRFHAAHIAQRMTRGGGMGGPQKPKPAQQRHAVGHGHGDRHGPAAAKAAHQQARKGQPAKPGQAPKEAGPRDAANGNSRQIHPAGNRPAPRPRSESGAFPGLPGGSRAARG